MNYAIIVVVLSIVSIFSVDPLMLQTPGINEIDNYGQGHNIVEIKSSEEATEEEEEAMEDEDDDD